MKRTAKALTCLFLAALLTAGLAAPAAARANNSDTWVSDMLAKTADLLALEIQTALKNGETFSEWALLGLVRSGIPMKSGLCDDAYDAIKTRVVDLKGVLSERRYTEYSRAVMLLAAMGENPKNIAGYDLIAPLGHYDNTMAQGLSGAIFALIALDSGGYDMPDISDKRYQATRDDYLDYILGCQLENGGFGWSGDTADVDLTSMALQALSNYTGRKAVKTAVNDALDYLSAAQYSDGGFGSMAGAEGISQVIIALGELGLDYDDGRFVKDGSTLLDALAGYRQGDGFYREPGAVNAFSTEQAFLALVSISRAQSGQKRLYDMSDVKAKPPEEKQDDSATGGRWNRYTGHRHSDVRRTSVRHHGRSFGDIGHHKNRKAIESLAERGVLDGKGNNTFSPDDHLTRAEFATIVVRGLGVGEKTTGDFKDVNKGSWYAGYVGAAHSYGLVKGVGDGCFAPDDPLTYEEAAVMVCRAAELCGMDTSLTETQIENALQNFKDSGDCASWARESVAFCIREGILDTGSAYLNPSEAITRSDMAEMFYRMLELSGLIDD